MNECNAVIQDDPQDPDRLLSFKEACGLLNVGERMLWSMCNRRELPGLRVGRLWRFRRESLLAWVAERETKGGAA